VAGRAVAPLFRACRVLQHPGLALDAEQIGYGCRVHGKARQRLQRTVALGRVFRVLKLRCSNTRALRIVAATGVRVKASERRSSKAGRYCAMRLATFLCPVETVRPSTQPPLET
jgi:hypothetical protein